MCEIYAVNARRDVRANAPLREFFADSPRHPHGWGLAWRRDDGSLWLDKEPLPAYSSEYLRYLLREPIRTSWLIAHIRNATRGVVTFDNCHPFRATDAAGTTWILAHNGTMLNEGSEVSRFVATQHGSTDSERVFLFLVDALNGTLTGSGDASSFNDRFRLLSDLMARLSPGNKLNLVFGDGTYTFAHTNTVQDTLWRHHGNGMATLCTRPLDDAVGGVWEPVPHCRLIAYRDGRVVAESAVHDGCFDDEVYMRAIERERLGVR